jgi:hypothetical protein
MFRSRKFALAVLILTAVSSTFASTGLLAEDEAVTNLRWKPGVIRIAVSASLLRESANIKRDSDVLGAIKRSIETWSRAANIEFVQTNSEKLSASPSGPLGDGVSLITIAPTAENVLLFAKDPENAAATTRVFYNRRGTITEADIVLNPYQQYSTDGTLGTFDLESTLTHEIGHLLGLTHSAVLGSTMYSNYGKNGVFGLQNFSARTLSADDMASVRAIYGVREDVLECCGSIEGRISLTGKQLRNVQIWAEDSAGRVHGSAKMAVDGEFHFAGLGVGKYRIFAQENGRSRSVLPVQTIGEAYISSDETQTLNAKLVARTREFDLTYLGFNGQLSEMAVALTPGRSYTVYLGGRNLDPKKLSISFTSPYISTVAGSLKASDYGDEVSVVTFEVRISPKAPRGEYSIVVESEHGDKRAIVGGLTIDNFVNPWAGLAAFE